MKKLDIKFRVLIIGRANAGKTSILQRVCDTTESPEIYRQINPWGGRERVQLDPTEDRGEHNITDELISTNHDGYLFHDSRGIESGSEDELKVIQNFIREKSTKKRVRDRLHAIWYCIPMDNQWPSLDLKFFNDICPDRNVPLIAVFTKYNQFKDNIEIRLKHRGVANLETEAPTEAERVFQEEYLGKLGGTPHFVRLESMHEAGKCCTELLEKTANALNDNVATVMLLALQRGNQELSVRLAVKRAGAVLRGGVGDSQRIIFECFKAFPHMWYHYYLLDDDLRLLDYLLDYDDDEHDLDLHLLDYDDLYEEHKISNQLKSLLLFVEKPEFSLHHHAMHHIMIAIILILEHATMLLFCGTNSELALSQAESHYMQTAYTKAAEQFPAVFQDYSDAVFLHFIFNNYL